ncbi:hypothetical protein H6P81_016689 [Aristolochia fimbriata]|uniref:Uncharacterized protein n=1 Tax=Aristolochia fimbriata TaxID=158543 RepID=A0AAV7E9P3_ARIFI|nr:hypothetical protein H6P81_016689 [Aristolochia fimbriata]
MDKNQYPQLLEMFRQKNQNETEAESMNWTKNGPPSTPAHNFYFGMILLQSPECGARRIWWQSKPKKEEERVQGGSGSLVTHRLSEFQKNVATVTSNQNLERENAFVPRVADDRNQTLAIKSRTQIEFRRRNEFSINQQQQLLPFIHLWDCLQFLQGGGVQKQNKPSLCLHRHLLLLQRRFP